MTAVAALVLARWLLRRRRRTARGRELIRYRVPTGQDPAAVLGRLRLDGVAAEPQVSDGDSVLAISLPPSASRESVRETIRDAPENMQGDPSRTGSVTFIDET